MAPARKGKQANNGNSYDKFKPTDMPEIRRVRSALLKSLKLVAKTNRLDKISKAIMPDVDWAKLSVNMSSLDPASKQLVDKLNHSLTSFRESLSDQLEDIMCSVSTDMEQRARKSSSPAIFQAAATMAQKYHSREKKTTSRPRPKTSQSDPEAVNRPTKPPSPLQKKSQPAPKTTQRPPKPTTQPPCQASQRPSSRTNQGPRTSKSPARTESTTAAPANPARRPFVAATRRIPTHPSKAPKLFFKMSESREAEFMSEIIKEYGSIEAYDAFEQKIVEDHKKRTKKIYFT